MDEKCAKRYSIGFKASLVGLLGNILLAILKMSAGYLAGSKAMIADGFHSISDLLSTLVVMVSLRISVKPPDAEHPYGHGRAESIAAKIVAVILVLTGLSLAWDSLQVVMAGEVTTPGTLALWGAILSILIKEGMFRYTHYLGTKISSQAVTADAWHHRSDAFSSIAALIGIGGARMGYPFMDGVGGIVVSLMIVWMGFKIATRAVGELMDTAPEEEVIKEITEDIMNCQGVRKINDLRVRCSGPDLFVDLKIVVKKGLWAYEAHDVCEEVKRIVMEGNPQVKDVLVHVDPEEIRD